MALPNGHAAQLPGPPQAFGRAPWLNARFYQPSIGARRGPVSCSGLLGGMRLFGSAPRAPLERAGENDSFWNDGGCAAFPDWLCGRGRKTDMPLVERVRRQKKTPRQELPARPEHDLPARIAACSGERV